MAVGCLWSVTMRVRVSGRRYLTLANLLMGSQLHFGT